MFAFIFDLLLWQCLKVWWYQLLTRCSWNHHLYPLILKMSYSYRTGVYRPYAIHWHIILGGKNSLCARELFLSNKIVPVHALKAATESQPTVLVTAASWYINAITLLVQSQIFIQKLLLGRPSSIPWCCHCSILFLDFLLVLSKVCVTYSTYFIISCYLALPWILQI